MSEEGFEDRAQEGEARAQARNRADSERALEGPGSDERLEHLRNRLRSTGASGAHMPVSQLILIGLAVFLLVLMFGAGRYVIAALAPKPPPGINAPLE